MKKYLLVLFLFLVIPAVAQQAPPALPSNVELPEGVTVDPDQSPDLKPAVISQDDIKKRLDELKTAREQVTANLQALDGAIQQCEWFMAELNSREKALKKKQSKANLEESKK
jgi:hypothetical protein